MGIFSTLTTEGVEESEERVGGGSFVRETDIYHMTIKLAYAGKSDGGAQNITFVFDDGKELRETIYYTNKQGQNYFHPKKAGSQERDLTKKNFLPGYDLVNEICLIASDIPLTEQETEEKVVNLWDKDAKKELPKAVQVLTSLLGKPVALAIQKVIQNKNEQQGNEWVPTAETISVNDIVKVFHPEFKVTVKEAGRATGVTDGVMTDKDGNPVGGFYDKWIENNQGKDKDKTDKSLSGNNSGRPGAAGGKAPPAGGNAGGAKRASLFGGGN